MQNYKDVQVSLYQSIYSDECTSISITDLIELIKSGKYKDRISLIRELGASGDNETANKEKCKLPGVTFSSEMDGKRISANVKKYNALIVLDYDKIDEDKIDELKKNISSDAYVFVVFLSPRNGLKVLVFVNSEQSQHKMAFERLSEYFKSKYGITADKQTSDVVRLTFLSDDPDIFINWEAKEFQFTIPVQEIAQEKEPIIKEAEKESYLLALTIYSFLKKWKKSITSTHEDWYKVAFALANTFSYDLGRYLFLKFCELDGEKFEMDKCLYQIDYSYERADENGVHFGTIVHFAKQQGFRLSTDDSFYSKKEEKLVINELAYIEFLGQKGYYSYRLENGHTLIRIENQIIEVVDIYDIKQFVIDYVKQLPPNLSESITSRELLSKMISLKHVLFSNAIMDFLPKADIKIHRDTRDDCVIYYNNGPVIISPSEVKMLSYNDLNGSIWKKQILNRNIVLHCNYQTSCFYRFINNICNNDLDRVESLKSAIGYLVHRYKDPIETKAIIFGDEKISDHGEANGGTGKSLVGEAISRIRNVLKIDGKNFSFGKFAFQQISPETDIVQFDDVKNIFDFEALYSGITTGLIVEKKGETPYVIAFEMAPKFEINTNYTIKGTGGNTEERRKFTIEFSDYYGPDRKPIDEFGHRFFVDWNEEEWNLFDNFIIHCVQLFLQKGLIPYQHRTLKLRDFIARTSEDFSEFTKIIKLEHEYDTQALHNRFLEEYPMYRNLSTRKFCKWLRHFLDAKNLKTYSMVNGGEHFQKRNGKQYIKIVDATKIQSDEETKKEISNLLN